VNLNGWVHKIILYLKYPNFVFESSAKYLSTAYQWCCKGTFLNGPTCHCMTTHIATSSLFQFTVSWGSTHFRFLHCSSYQVFIHHIERQRWEWFMVWDVALWCYKKRCRFVQNWKGVHTTIPYVWYMLVNLSSQNLMGPIILLAHIHDIT